jgi:hypothetical protein
VVSDSKITTFRVSPGESIHVSTPPRMTLEGRDGRPFYPRTREMIMADHRAYLRSRRWYMRMWRWLMK